jgi:DNA-binding response OmpR family regulator
MSLKTILVVDDEAAIRKLLTRALRRDGIEVITTDTAASAERLFEHRRVDLILCDDQLPGEIEEARR